MISLVQAAASVLLWDPANSATSQATDMRGSLEGYDVARANSALGVANQIGAFVGSLVSFGLVQAGIFA